MPDPVVWLVGAIASLAGFTGWLVRWVLKHLESDLAYSRRTVDHGVRSAKGAIEAAEAKAE